MHAPSNTFGLCALGVPSMDDMCVSLYTFYNQNDTFKIAF